MGQLRTANKRRNRAVLRDQTIRKTAVHDTSPGTDRPAVESTAAA